MLVISPKLTGLMAVVVTTIVTVGSLLGSVLRQLSRTSQAQVSSTLISARSHLRPCSSYTCHLVSCHQFTAVSSHNSFILPLAAYSLIELQV